MSFLTKLFLIFDLFDLFVAKLQIKIMPPLTDYSDHPRYNVAKRSNPYDAHHKRDGKPILESGFLAVGNCAHEYQMNGPCCYPSGLS